MRIPLLVLAMVSLVVGLCAGLVRMGWPSSTSFAAQAMQHGFLMVAAFFGTVISLERAVALNRTWAYLAPLCSGLGGVMLILGAPPWIAGLLLLFGGFLFVAASIAVLLVQPVLHNSILLLGAVALPIGNLLWLTWADAQVAIHWWLAFFVLTIAGERLELSRLVVRSAVTRALFALLCPLPLFAALSGFVAPNLAELLMALGLAGIALWLLFFDIARRTVRQAGLPRFTAVCMLTGYAWLLLAAFLLLGKLFLGWTVPRDAVLHAVFLGFVFAMVIGHALIIFPAVTRLKMPYSPVFYLPLVLLHGTLALRVSGALFADTQAYQWGGLLNAMAVAVFVGVVLISAVRGFWGRVKKGYPER